MLPPRNKTSAPRPPGGLDRCKACARHHHCSSPLKALDSAAHGSLQLEHGRAGPVTGVDRLLVLDQGQGQGTAAGI